MTGDDHGEQRHPGPFRQLPRRQPRQLLRRRLAMHPQHLLHRTRRHPIAERPGDGYIEPGIRGRHCTSTPTAPDWTSASLESGLRHPTRRVRREVPERARPDVEPDPLHPWSDWSTQANVESSHGIRLDTNYYYWPPNWVQDRAGFFTGSGIPMRFTNSAATMIDVYRQPPSSPTSPARATRPASTPCSTGRWAPRATTAPSPSTPTPTSPTSPNQPP